MKFRLSIYLISLLVISSCGGGGGGGGGSPEPQVPSASITMSISSPQIYISQDLSELSFNTFVTSLNTPP